jgi:hypothetical protein
MNYAKGYPVSLTNYKQISDPFFYAMEYVLNLDFNEDPDYDMLIDNFKELLEYTEE